MPTPLPVAALGVIVYVGPGDTTVAVATAPELAKVTPVTLSPLYNVPVVVNAVVPNDKIVPYVLVWLLAVTVSGAGLTVRPVGALA